MLELIYLLSNRTFLASIMGKKKKVYNRIKAAIAEQGQTSLWLSKELGVSPVTVSKWCRNEMQPTMESLFNVANALRVDVRTLLVSNLKKE